ncbi:MAG: DUF1232 domain-containing protein [Muribaculaceae bacterium]|nr:DUF1232 domain-containing protein [Muribaculaceae bacterium]
MKKESFNTANYAKDYSDEALRDKIIRFGKKMGSKLLYNVYVLYYVLKSVDVPIKVKLEIIGALGYVIVPLDLIPDFIPVAGFTDDLAAIAFAVHSARSHITPEIQQKAELKVYEKFGTLAECELAA